MENPIPRTRRKSALHAAEIRRIARQYTTSEKDGSERKAGSLTVEMAIRKALEVAGVKVKEDNSILPASW